MQSLKRSTHIIDTLLKIAFWWLVALTAYYCYYYILSRYSCLLRC